jgi:hypothetical protein
MTPAGSDSALNPCGAANRAQRRTKRQDRPSGRGIPNLFIVGDMKSFLDVVLCLPVGGLAFVDVPLAEIAVTSFPFEDIYSAPWAQVGRAGMEIAIRRGFAAGFFTGHQLEGRCGWIGIAPERVSVFDVDDATIGASRWAFTDVNTAPWAQAARCATEICLAAQALRLAGGFFSGHQLPNKRQIVAFRQR